MQQIDIQAFIFDMDGVLADTIEPHYHAWKRFADEEGVYFDRVMNEDLRGLARRDCLHRILAGRELDEATIQEMMHRKNVYFHEMLDQFTPADRLPGVTDLLADVRRHGLAVGVASSSRNTKPVLTRLELWDAFDVVGDRNVVSNAKPQPDVFLWVAGALRVPPRNALVLEDSRFGVEAAHRGGFWSVGLGAHAEGAHVQLPDLQGTTVAGLLDLLARSQAAQVQTV